MGIFKLPVATTTERTSITPDVGELIFDTDTEEVYKGDGATVGGVLVGGGGSGTVDSVVGTTDEIDVDATDPANPIVSLASAVTSSLALADSSVQLAFKTIAVSGQSDVVADSATDTLTLVAGSNVTITTNASTDTITIAASGGGGGGAPTDASYVTLGTNGTLTDERVLTAGTGISLTDNGAGSTVILASTITQYTDELAQDAVGGIFTDSSEIDFTYNDATPSITASIIAGSIDETKLDASVNASLDLADSALQAAAIGVSVQGYSAVLAATTASFTTADETKLDGIEAGADVTDATNVAAAGAVMESDTSTVSMSFVIDEDNMASDLATKVPTQQSVKAYVDTGLATKQNSLGYTAENTANKENTTIDTSTTKYPTVNLLKTGLDTKQPLATVLTNTTASFTTAQETKLGYITVTQAVNLDTLESDTVTNNAKVTNATHTGDVTGATALTIDKTAITGKTEVTAEAGVDYMLISDTSDSGNLKKALVPTSSGGSLPVKKQLTTGQATTSTSLADVTELVFAVAANTSYKFDFGLYYQSSVGTEGLGLGVNCPSGATISYIVEIFSSTAGAGRFESTTTADTKIQHTSGSTSGMYAKVIGTVDVAGTSGNLALRFATETGGANSNTLLTGSYGVLTEVDL